MRMRGIRATGRVDNSRSEEQKAQEAQPAPQAQQPAPQAQQPAPQAQQPAPQAQQPAPQAQQPAPQAQQPAPQAQQGPPRPATGESLFAGYLRRFKRHTLGKVGGTVLLLLYGGALLADFIAPFDMTWTDKRKSFHPPTPIRVAYLDRGELIVRPFTLELQLVNPMRKSYAPVPRHTVRTISVETEPRRRELRVVATEESAADRRAAVVVGVRSHYSLDSDHPALERLSAALQELENAERRDLVTTVDLGTRRVGEREVPLQVILAKGNKNFVSLLAPGIPYRLLGLFTARRHLLGSPSGGVFLLGADQFGRDVLSRLIHGSRVSLSVGLIGVTVSFVFGLLAGGVAGYFGGQTDNGLMRLTEVLLAFPSLYLLFTLRATFPDNLTSVQVYLLIALILAFVGWARLARVIRGLVLSIRTEEYILSARSLGLGPFKIIRRHVLPNTFSYVIVDATLTIPAYILGESALSLLGLGITEPQSSWGLMLAVARNHRILADFPWILVPGVAIFVAIMAWNLFGDGIRDAVDPRSRL